MFEAPQTDPQQFIFNNTKIYLQNVEFCVRYKLNRDNTYNKKKKTETGNGGFI